MWWLAVCGALAPSRRMLFKQAVVTVAAPQAASAVSVVEKSAPSTGLTGLVLLPPKAPLRNTYYMVRAAENKQDAEGVIETNAATKMLIARNALTQEGQRQAFQAAAAIDAQAPLIFYSTGRASEETAGILQSVLGTPFDRLVPEYMLLDARGLGAHEGDRLSRLDELHELYDGKSRFLRPPEGEDGSYAESVDDVYARFRQVLSKLETMHCGETVVLVAPGDDMFSIAHAALTGSDLRRHFELKSVPGQVACLPKDPPLEVGRFHEPGRKYADEQRAKQTLARADLTRLSYDFEMALKDVRRAVVNKASLEAATVVEVGAAKEMSMPLVAATFAALAAFTNTEKKQTKPQEEEPAVSYASLTVGDKNDVSIPDAREYDDDAWLKNIQAIIDDTTDVVPPPPLPQDDDEDRPRGLEL